MSTGIGNHKLNLKTIGKGAYSTPLAICPYCGFDQCPADWVDVGVGMVQCGPYHCERCGASEISSLDKRGRTKKEALTGWYEPASPVSENANTYKGVLVDHRTAKQLYEVGLLDERSEEGAE